MFITLEGTDGSGKSTAAKMLSDYFLSQKRECILTREVGGTAFAELIRSIVIDRNDIDTLTEMMLIIAARRDHCRKVILPALMDGKIVICDRYFDSTIAYQILSHEENYAMSHEQKVDLIEYIHEIHTNLMQCCMPDKTFFLNVSPELCRERMVQRNAMNGTTTRFDEAGIEFHTRVHAAYVLLSSMYDRIITIDASQTTENVVQCMINTVT